MIISLLEEAESILRTYTDFRQAKLQTTEINTTLKALEESRRSANSFARHYQLLNQLVGDRLPANFIERIAALQQKIGESQAAFATQPLQSRELGAIESEVKKLDGALLNAWSHYANEQIRPHQQLYELLSDLPEIRNNPTNIKSSLSELVSQAQTLPQNSVQLRIFQDKVEEIADLLTSIEGITPVIRDFLRRVQQKSFTLADLNDEILIWCRINNRGRNYKVVS